MSKRASISSAAMGTKKAKVAVDQVAAKLAQVASVFEDAGLPSTTSELISAVIPNCLGVVSEERHRFQVEAVEMIQRELATIQTGYEKSIEVACAAKEEAAQKVTAQVAVVTKLQEGLDAKREHMQGRKSILAEDARSFQKTKALRSERLAQRESGLSEVSKAEASKVKVEGFAKESETLHESEDAAKACSVFLTKLSKHVTIDDTMKTAIPAALTKSADTRGGFDAMVVQQLNASIAKRLEELSAKIANAEPIKTALETDVATAEKQHQAAKDKQIESARVFVEARTAVDSDDEKVKALRKELTSLKRHEKKASDGEFDAQSSLDVFKSGALEAFDFLRTRSAPLVQDMECAPAELPDITSETPAEAAAVAAC